MACRAGCGACCIAASISSPIPGMPQGKPAGQPCIHLTPDARCAIYRHPDRPACCDALKPAPELCGATREDALAIITELERLTAPAA